jgi:predicted phosphatase
MGLFGKFKKDESLKVVDTGYQSFSTPFLRVGESNLSLPFVDSRYTVQGYVRFGEGNLYPQLLNQMYYTSPLHGSIVDFKTNATIGGGYTFDESKLTDMEKVVLYAFGKKIGFKETLKTITKDIIIHGRCYFLIELKDGKTHNVKRVAPEKVRINQAKTLYAVNEDWQFGLQIRTYEAYHPECKNGTYLYAYEQKSVGQDYYPLPQYTSALNFAFLSGELSYLQKSNIQNSIFPSFAMMFPKKPQGNEEMQLIKDTVNKLKGAENSGKVVAFFANNKESLPDLVNVPTNSNDELFKGVSELNTEQICFAHTIDPILLGVRTTGSLGSGSDIKQAYVIFEKNTIIPLRETITDIINGLMRAVGIEAKVEITNYQIVNETITSVDEQGSEVTNALNAMSPLVATKVLEAMTINEIRAMAALAPVPDGDIVQSQIVQTPPTL